MNRFAVIDSEGNIFKKDKLDSSLIIAEVSVAIFIKTNNKFELKAAHSYRLDYDLRELNKYNNFRIQFRYLTKHFYPTFKNKLYVNNGNNPSKIRSTILNLIGKYNCNDLIFAKGNYQESVWLYYPECCDGNFGLIPKNILRINELEDYRIPKYDDILDSDKTKMLEYFINKINSSSESDFIFKPREIEHYKYDYHYSLYEILVFGQLLINLL